MFYIISYVSRAGKSLNQPLVLCEHKHVKNKDYKQKFSIAIKPSLLKSTDFNSGMSGFPNTSEC